MMLEELVSWTLMLVFAGVVGHNDGASLLTLASRGAVPRLWLLAGLLSIGVVLVPAAGADRVGATVSRLIVPAHPALGMTVSATTLTVLLATTCTIALSRAVRVPTSITLALIGAGGGVTMWSGSIQWPEIVRVLVLAALAPAAAWCCAEVLGSGTRLIGTGNLSTLLRVVSVLGMAFLLLAYCLNDGQKLAAVAWTVAGPGGDQVYLSAAALVLSCVAFLVGSLLGLRGSARSLRTGPFRPGRLQATVTSWAAALSVLLGSAAGSPISMTQAMVGGLVGCCPGSQWRRVRWQQVGHVVIAWLWTLPVAFLLAWVIGGIWIQLTWTI